MTAEPTTVWTMEIGNWDFSPYIQAEGIEAEIAIEYAVHNSKTGTFQYEERRE